MLTRPKTLNIHISYIRNRVDSYRMSMVDVPAQEVRDSSSGVPPCTVMKIDRVPYHQVSSFSPERWTKLVLQGRAVVGSGYRLAWKYSMVQQYPISVIRHNEHHLQRTLSRPQFLCKRRTGLLPFMIGVSSSVRMSDPRFRQ